MTIKTNKDLKKSMKIGDIYHGEYRADGLRIFSPSREQKTENGSSMAMKAPVLTVSDFFENPEDLAVQFAKALNDVECRPYIGNPVRTVTIPKREADRNKAAWNYITEHFPTVQLCGCGVYFDTEDDEAVRGNTSEDRYCHEDCRDEAEYDLVREEGTR